MESQVIIAANLAQELNKAKEQLQAHTQANTVDSALVLLGNDTRASVDSASQSFASLLANAQGSSQASPQPISAINRWPDSVLPYCLVWSSVNSWLFKVEDFPVSPNKSHLLALIQQANEPSTMMPRARLCP
jgi:hypothetical protein